MTRRSGASPLLIVVVGALLVFGGYFVWIGFLDFLEDQGNITANVTRDVNASATARAAPQVIIPSRIAPPATFTPIPPCQWFTVNVSNAVYRECPSTDNQQCPRREVIPYGTELCVYSRVPGNTEWFVVDLNPDGAYRDTVYIHESVVEAVNPTRTPAPTVTPLPINTPGPTNTPTPTHTSAPTVTTPRPSPTPPTSTGAPTVTPQPSGEIEI